MILYTAHFDKKVKLKYQIDKQRQTFKCPQNCIKKTKEHNIVEIAKKRNFLFICEFMSWILLFKSINFDYKEVLVFRTKYFQNNYSNQNL